MRDSETYTQGETRTDVVCPVALHFLLEVSKSAAYLHFSFFSGSTKKNLFVFVKQTVF
jgi:hypothetical protein